MTHEPTVTIPAISSFSKKKRQYATVLPVRILLLLVASIIQQKDRGAGFRLDALTAKKISETWWKRGDVECLSPMILAIRKGATFTNSKGNKEPGLGTLSFPFDSVVDVCDGIQRIAAAQVSSRRDPDMLRNEWPVQLIETSDEADLLAINAMMRRQTQVGSGQTRRKPFSRTAETWTAKVIGASRFLQKAVDPTRSSLAPRSSCLWAGSAITGAFSSVLHAGILTGTPESANDYGGVWDNLVAAIDLLASYEGGETTAAKLRKETILAQSPTVHALAMLAAMVSRPDGTTIGTILPRLRDFDWSQGAEKLGKMRPTERRSARIQRLLSHCGLDPGNDATRSNS